MRDFLETSPSVNFQNRPKVMTSLLELRLFPMISVFNPSLSNSSRNWNNIWEVQKEIEESGLFW